MKYRPEIDGLRAVAVVPVILFHAGFPFAAGGFVGVDVFFVISGYLITTLLIQDLENGRFSILHFYERRARRILPALFVVLATCVPFAWAWMHPAQLHDFGLGLAAVLAFGSNILFWRQIDYFAPAAEENPLLHTWSLAVEEQFYLFFPLLLLWLWRSGGARRAGWLLGGLALASLILAEWGWRVAPGANFYLIPSRAWELFAGVLCALAIRHGPLHPRPVLAATGLGMIGLGIVLFDGSTPFPSLWALLPVGGTVLVILFASPSEIVGRLLAARPVVAVGLISYSAYLWHQPLFAFARIRSPGPPETALMLGLIAATFILAGLSWYFVEQPFRRRPAPVLARRASLFAGSAAVGAVFAALAAWIVLHKGLPQRIAPSGQSFAILDIDARLRPNRGLHPDCIGPASFTGPCSTAPNPGLLLWGDSFAMHLGQAVAANDSGVRQRTMPVCAPIEGLAIVNPRYPRRWAEGCIAFNARVLAELEEHPGVRQVVMSSPMAILRSRVLTADGRLLREDEAPAAVEAALRRTAERIRAAGAEPVFVTPPPRTGEDLASCAVKALVFGGASPDVCDFPKTRIWDENHAVIAFLNRLAPDFRILPLEMAMCPEGQCITSAEGNIIYRDSGHLSEEGARWLGRQPAFQSVLGTRP